MSVMDYMYNVTLILGHQNRHFGQDDNVEVMDYTLRVVCHSERRRSRSRRISPPQRKHKNVGENTKMLYKHNKIVLYCGQQKEKGLKGWLKRTRTG